MPTATHGLKGKVQSIVRELDAMRSARRAPRNISLRQYLAEKHKLTPGHLFSELAIDAAATTLEELMGDEDNRWLVPEIIREGISKGMGLAQREQAEMLRRAIVSQAVTGEQDGGKRWITPELFMDPVMRGVVQNVFYPDLVVREIMVGQPTVTIPKLELSDAQLADSEEAATIEEGTVTYGDKTVKIEKKAKGIKITYEALKFNNLDLVALFFEDLGRILGSNLNGKAVETIIDGDQADGSEAAAVVGVNNTTDGITYFDIVRLWVRFSLLGRRSTSIVGNETTAVQYLDLPEVKNKQNLGSSLLPTNIKTPLPTDQDLYVSIKVPANQLVFQDSGVSLVQLTAWPLMVESERIVSKQIAGTFASIYTGFAKLQRNASVVLDKSVAFSGAGFPSWMAPYAD